MAQETCLRFNVATIDSAAMTSRINSE